MADKTPQTKRASFFSRASLQRMKEVWYSFFVVWFWQTITFTGLLMVYLLNVMLVKLFSLPVIPKKIQKPVLSGIHAIYRKVVLSSTKQERTINRVSLIDLAIKNMMFKKSRAFITVGGMAIGIGAIVFLVSIGFGLQELVISRVARLDELRQADVTVQPGSKETITDETLAKLKDFEHLEQALPMIVSVARVEFQNSISDMAVYGVTADYLKQSAVQPVYGVLFDSNEISNTTSSNQEKSSVEATVVTEYQDGDYELLPQAELPIEFSLPAKEMVRVRIKADKNADLIGYTRNQYAMQQGWRVWGGTYAEAAAQALLYEEVSYGPWIKSTFPIWLEASCAKTEVDCVDGQYVSAKTSDGKQLFAEGFVAASNATIHSTLISQDPLRLAANRQLALDDAAALTEATVAASVDEELAGIVDLGDEWVEIASEAAAVAGEKVTKISLSDGAKKQAVVNRAMLQILGLPEDQAVGKTFSASFVVVGDLLDRPGEKVESIPTEYQIIGVVPDDKTPYFYVPFIDLRLLGITHYSQLKVVADAGKTLADLRKQVESLGFTTRSVADTVDQIDRLFATARLVLAIVGFVALSIAALGMFNTLTVSLLERTREVGLMKAMGMRSNEVRELFLTESLVMGFFGGVFGIILGSLMSELLGLLLSTFAIGKGVGFLDISYLPASFVIFIFLLSLIVGVFTGVYPARRATKISALNALRYE